jgi:CubicO group peptidase (beta-lactamase class C family)
MRDSTLAKIKQVGRSKLVALVLVQLTAAPCLGYAAPALPKVDHDARAHNAAAALVDAAARAYLDDASASAVQIAIWKSGKLVYSRAHGFADPERTVAVTPRSLFQIGSNGKKATALAVLRAVDDGRLRLDDSVAEVLPQFVLEREPGWADKATVRDLLSHQSGLWDYASWEDAPNDHALAQTLHGTFAQNEWATTEPGDVWNYSNAGYAVLGAILERAYRRSYPDVMAREVYAPLGLSNTYARRADAIATGRAVWGFGAGREQTAGLDPFDLSETFSDTLSSAAEWVAPADTVDNAFTRPAGLSWSTAEDECRVGAFLLEGRRRVLREVTRREMLTPQTLLTPGETVASYSFGLILARGVGLGPDAFYDVPVIMHDGATLTMASTFLALPEHDFVMSVLRNANDAPASLIELQVTALRQYAGLTLPGTPPAPSEPDDGARYAGTYSDPQAFGTLELRWDGAQLSVRAPDIEALGGEVDPEVVIARKNVLMILVDGQPVELTVWPSASSEAGYLVSRHDAFTRVGD